MKKSKRFKMIVWDILLSIMIVVAVLMLFNKPIANYFIKNFKPDITAQSIDKNKYSLAKGSSVKNKEKPSYDWNKVNSLTTSKVLNARLHSDKAIFVGYVAVPDADVVLPISEGVSDISLSLGAGTVKPNQTMGSGNYSLASHFIRSNHRVLFTPLYYKGKVGQKIYLTDLNKVYEYTTNVYKRVASNDIQVIDDTTTPEVTLITCNYSHEQGRLVMKGKLTKTYSWSQAPYSVKQYIRTHDNRLTK